MQADRQRLGAGDLAQRNVFGHRRELARVHDEAFAEQALHVRVHAGAAQEAHVAAQVETAFAAVIAGAARVRGVDRDFHARLQAVHAAAGAQHHARGLVPRDERFADHESAHPSMLEIVQVRSADARRPQPQLHVLRRQRRRFLGRQAQIPRPVDAADQAAALALYRK
ncbi:hypothetical protein AD428_18645, partial [Achromobacter sp. DMS1]